MQVGFITMFEEQKHVGQNETPLHHSHNLSNIGTIIHWWSIFKTMPSNGFNHSLRSNTTQNKHNPK
jgi:hypothetical protein